MGDDEPYGRGHHVPGPELEKLPEAEFQTQRYKDTKGKSKLKVQKARRRMQNAGCRRQESRLTSAFCINSGFPFVSLCF
jgi:hypothetical protein